MVSFGVRQLMTTRAYGSVIRLVRGLEEIFFEEAPERVEEELVQAEGRVYSTAVVESSWVVARWSLTSA